MLSKAINNIQAKKLSIRKASVTYSVSNIFENYFNIFLRNKKQKKWMVCYRAV